MPTSSQTTINVPSAASGPLVPPSPYRKGLMIVSGNTNRFTISQSLVAVLDQGITLYPTDRPIVLTEHEHGEMVKRAWQAISAAAPQNVTFFEWFA
jgi:hypothetical protein